MVWVTDETEETSAPDTGATMTKMQTLRHAAVLSVLALSLASGCQKDQAPGPPPVAVNRLEPESPPPDAGAPAAATNEEGCVDAWLAAQKLDAYGSPEGTMYAGGTPLFDESTGATKERLPFVYEKHPAAKAACQR